MSNINKIFIKFINRKINVGLYCNVYIWKYKGKGEIEKANLQRFYCTFLDSNCEEAKQVVIDMVYDSLTSVSYIIHSPHVITNKTRFV